jgi:dihydrofolate reductase
MKTQYLTATSVDGFIADPNHSLDWLTQLADSPVGEFPEFLRAVGSMAMGSSTYEWLLRHQVFPETGDPKPWPYEQPSWVFTSRDLRRVHGADIRFVRGDVRPVHAEMAAAAYGKNIWIVGGGDLAGQFADQGLLDEMILQVASVALGAGAPLFPRRMATPPLRLVDVKHFSTTFAQLTYELPNARGAPDTGPGRHRITLGDDSY